MDQLPFYVVNLARSPDRRAAMKRRLDTLGLAHAFFDGVDASRGEHLPVSRYAPRWARWLRQRPMSAAEIGCFASHYRLWQQCASGAEPMIVMEDDVTVDDGFADVVPLVRDAVTGSGFVRLAGLNEVDSMTIRQLDACYRLARLLKGPAGTQCYAISPGGAGKLLAGADRWIEPVDDYLDRFWSHGVQSMAILPYRVHHDDEQPSLIGKDRDNRQRSIIGAVGRTVSGLYASLARRLSNIRHLGLGALRG
ncbi:MAG TPA: glycosyltransferase family 25 protein [Rhizobiaceae bacterium]|nr:glycosyltransferase family 25 protein [Rhizobiaceae bacterium]